jgi:cilia- and flagella-associated protein 43
VPAFVKEKAQEEWTIDEQKQYSIYEQKTKELNEERDKLRKQLLTEINKINEQILEIYQIFDSVLLGLHYRKMKAQQAIYQEELKILRLTNNLIVDTALEIYERQINEKLENIQEQKKHQTVELQKIKKTIDSFREKYEILVAEDRSQDKIFLREFSDVPGSQREQLLKLFKKRTKAKSTINKASLINSNNNSPSIENGESEQPLVHNPFAERPSTAQQIQAYNMENQMALLEFDSFDNAPGIDRPVWDRFVDYRRQKIELENTLRMKSLTLNEMQMFLQKRTEDDDLLKREIDQNIRRLLK